MCEIILVETDLFILKLNKSNKNIIILTSTRINALKINY